jgi:hypothetical protein
VSWTTAAPRVGCVVRLRNAEATLHSWSWFVLFTIDDKPITEIPRSRADYFRAGKTSLGPSRTEEVHDEFNRLIDEL